MLLRTRLAGPDWLARARTSSDWRPPCSLALLPGSRGARGARGLSNCLHLTNLLARYAHFLIALTSTLAGFYYLYASDARLEYLAAVCLTGAHSCRRPPEPMPLFRWDQVELQSGCSRVVMVALSDQFTSTLWLAGAPDMQRRGSAKTPKRIPGILKACLLLEIGY